MIKEYAGNDYNEIIKDGVVVVDFFATWCGPCKMLAPEFKDLADEMTDVTFVTVDIDNYRDLAVENKVVSVPTLVLYKDGEEVSRRSGFAPKAQLQKWVSDNA